MRKLIALLALTAAFGAAHAQEKVLRVVPHSNLAILDPITTTAYITRNHGYMIYDTLFGPTPNPGQPQMVDKYDLSKVPITATRSRCATASSSRRYAGEIRRLHRLG